MEPPSALQRAHSERQTGDYLRAPGRYFGPQLPHFDFQALQQPAHPHSLPPTRPYLPTLGSKGEYQGGEGEIGGLWWAIGVADLFPLFAIF